MACLDQDSAGLPDKFLQASTPGQPKQAVTLELDADLLAWLKNEPGSVQSQVNDLLRFWKDTSQAKAEEFDPEAWEPGELAPAF